MEVGDLITISKSPWDRRVLFGYKNGDVAMVLQLHPIPSHFSLPSVIVYVFASNKTVTIPILYITTTGE
jgi:hypothetical protein